MANVTKLNSGKGLVTFSQKDLIEHNLLRYVRTSFKGIGKKGLLADHPFETVASDMYKEKYPSDQVKLAEKCMLRDSSDGSVSVDVILRVALDVSEGLYANHPDTVVFRKQEKTKANK